MKGTLIALFVTVAASILGGIAHAQVPFGPSFQVRQIPWRVNTGTCNPCDSLLKNLDGNGLTAFIADTSEWISTAEWAWPTGGTTGSSNAPARLYVVSMSGTVATTDTLFAAIDVSPDMGVSGVLYSPPSVSPTGIANGMQAYTGYLFGAANDNTVTFPLTVDSDVALNVYAAPWIRVRVHGDNSASSTFKNASLWLVYPKRAY